jgi:phosphoesterase RecJ-like protein
MREEIVRSFAAIGEIVASAKRIIIASHARPDGDAVGSALALGRSLLAAGKDVTVVNEDGLPETYAFLDPDGLLQHPSAVSGPFDLAIALDTANKERLGAHTLALFGDVRCLVNIDHHVSNESYGDLNCIDDGSPAAGQIVFEYIRQHELPLPDLARDALFVALSTDTGSFQYPATTARTYEIGAELITAGADVGDLSSKTYDNFSLRRLLVLRELLGVLKLSSRDRVASWSLTLEMKHRLAVHPGDTENLIDHLRGIKGVVVAVFFEELNDGSVRISMRSKSGEIADVCRICQRFAGGGHRLASGARVPGTLSDIETQVLKRIDLVLENGEY